MGIFGLNRQERLIWEKIEPNDRVRIRLEDGRVYFSKVRRIDSNSIDIESLLEGLTFIELLPKSLVYVEIISSQKGKIVFTTRVISPNWEGSNIIKLACPRTIENVQRRRFYRLEAILEVEYCLLSQEDINLDSLGLRPPIFNGFTKDISEGGIFFITTKLLDKETLINMRIKLDERYIIRARGLVLRVDEASTKGKYGIGIEFVKISEEDKDFLRRFIFEKSKMLARLKET
ncbi:MAG: PilZ domain-containing protein [Candidatus Omnitrophica bacterium]|nr:PilZ domain-containing protein [Candidatus Omnitrophota bacterium]